MSSITVVLVRAQRQLSGASSQALGVFRCQWRQMPVGVTIHVGEMEVVASSMRQKNDDVQRLQPISRWWDNACSSVHQQHIATIVPTVFVDHVQEMRNAIARTPWSGKANTFCRGIGRQGHRDLRVPARRSTNHRALHSEWFPLCCRRRHPGGICRTGRRDLHWNHIPLRRSRSHPALQWDGFPLCQCRSHPDFRQSQHWQHFRGIPVRTSTSTRAPHQQRRVLRWWTVTPTTLPQIWSKWSSACSGRWLS